MGIAGSGEVGSTTRNAAQTWVPWGRGSQTGAMSSPMVDSSVYLERLARVRDAMAANDVDALLLSVGHDLPYLTGYTAMPLERLTMLVVPRDAAATMLIPALEAPRVRDVPGVFDLLPWGETQDPTAIVARLAGGAQRIAVGDQMWARFLVELLPQLPGAEYTRAVDVVGPLRMSKDQAEIDALAAAGAAVDRIAGELQRGEIPLVGRTEAEVSAHLGRRIIEEGHDKVNFAIVAAGENAASPHHHPGSRVIGTNEIVLCDFGGTMAGYCSDTTRCVFTGEPTAEVAEAYEVLFEAQRVGAAAGVVGTPCEDVDRATRKVIDDAGFGQYFIHRTGHGIGLEEHEDPYIVEGNSLPLEAGHAYSVEPGIYVPGKWGMRLEDIVVATDAGPRRLNNSDHGLVVGRRLMPARGCAGHWGGIVSVTRLRSSLGGGLAAGATVPGPRSPADPAATEGATVLDPFNHVAVDGRRRPGDDTAVAGRCGVAADARRRNQHRGDGDECAWFRDCMAIGIHPPEGFQSELRSQQHRCELCGGATERIGGHRCLRVGAR